MNEFYKNKRVFVTGHTGFKGSWLCLWLHIMGAEVFGYSIDPPSEPNLFNIAEVSKSCTHQYGNINDYDMLKRCIIDFQPEIVIHLAAQSLVRQSYKEPMDTYLTNIMGTVHILEIARKVNSIRAILNVTTDKCYENKETQIPYTENDPMGGHDPYSSSKGCSELITSAYIRSFYNVMASKNHKISAASARSGNVIGGGDFAQDRLVPDIFRAFSQQKALHIRYPLATRPWQFVLEPLFGYLLLCKKLYNNDSSFVGPWNFGPKDSDIQQVEWVANSFAAHWGENASIIIDKQEHPHESTLLKLNSTKARTKLGWKTRFNISDAVQWTSDWYKTFYTDPTSIKQLTRNQIIKYMNNEIR